MPLFKMPSFQGKPKKKTPQQLVKKAKELLNLLEPSFTASGEAWMSWRTEGPPISPTPKAISASHFNGPAGPLDGSASSVSTASTGVSIGYSNGSSTGTSTSTSNGSGSGSSSISSSSNNGNGNGNGNGEGKGLSGRVRNLSSLSLSSLGGSAGEPPTPTSGNGSGVSPKSKPSPEEEARRRLVKCLRRMRDMLYGGAGCNRNHDKEPCTKEAKILAQELIKEDIIALLLLHFPVLPFEARKDTVRVFGDLAYHNWSGFADPYLSTKRFDVIEQLVLGYNNSSVAAKCGTMLRDALRNEKVARRFLNSGQVWPFFDSYVHMRNFEVASDAFATLKELLLQHKKTIPNFLDHEYEKFFDSYRRMLRSDNYVTKRQSLRLLEDILVDRHNFQIMTRFVRCVENLKAIMMLLREGTSPITQYEAFCIFRIFVVNPHIPHVIQHIFVRNRVKLEAYIMKLGRPRRGGDEDEEDQKAFEEEKEMIIERLKELEAEDRARMD